MSWCKKKKKHFFKDIQIILAIPHTFSSLQSTLYENTIIPQTHGIGGLSDNRVSRVIVSHINTYKLFLIGAGSLRK